MTNEEIIAYMEVLVKDAEDREFRKRAERLRKTRRLHMITNTVNGVNFVIQFVCLLVRIAIRDWPNVLMSLVLLVFIVAGQQFCTGLYRWTAAYNTDTPREPFRILFWTVKPNDQEDP